MRLSITITDYSWPDQSRGLGPALTDVACAADDIGLDTVWVADHLLQADPASTPDSEMLEAYTTLGFIAAQTERIRLGTLVTAVTYRPASLLIKAVTTLDVLSGGRAWLGVGAGYHEGEAQAMGLPLPPAAERFRYLGETLRLAKQMWQGDPSPFAGERLQLSRPVGSPLPATRPHPPILVGGTGERQTLRLVARYGDACNLFDIPDGGRTIAQKLAVLQRHCQDAGREMADIETTVSTRIPPNQPIGDFIGHSEDLGSLGIEHVIVLSAGPWTADTVRSLGPVAAALQDR